MRDPDLPILYSFRRCPYAIRARLALQVAGLVVELREVVLRDKPQAFLDASPSATVPCLVLPDRVLDESLDIMTWALSRNDPEGWLDMPEAGWAWIDRSDGPFKHALDRTKYPNRYPETETEGQRERAAAFLSDLDAQIDTWIFDKPTLADYALLPFIRQFAFIDKAWFDSQNWPRIQAWLQEFLVSERFAEVMIKHIAWQPKAAPIRFPSAQ